MISPSSDEGEVVDSEAVEILKTSSTLPRLDGSAVDSRDRLRARLSVSPSPKRHSRCDHSAGSRRSRSPQDPKRFRRERGNVPLEGSSFLDDSPRHHPKRHLTSYEDLDSPVSATDRHREVRDRNGDRRESDRNIVRDRDRDHDRDRNQTRDHDWRRDGDRHFDGERKRGRDDRYERLRQRGSHPDNFRRNRSRSPRHRSQRHAPLNDRHAGAGGRPEGLHGRNSRPQLDEQVDGYSRYTHKVSRQATVADSLVATSLLHTEGSTADATASSAPHVANGSVTEVLEQPQDIELPKLLDEEAEIARRRLRRQQIMATSKSVLPLLQIVNAPDKAATSPKSTAATDASPNVDESAALNGSAFSGADVAEEGLSEEYIFDKENDLVNKHSLTATTEENGPSAAEYDPTAHGQEDELRGEIRHATVGRDGENGQGRVEAVGSASAVAKVMKTEETRGSKQKNGHIEDQDGDSDEFDMFAEKFDEQKYVAERAINQANIKAGQGGVGLATGEVGGLLEGDDADGYYKIRIGEVVNGRYQIQMAVGRGMFSGVARAQDLKTDHLVAIKIVRNNYALRKSGFTEISILQKLNDADLEGRKHIVKFERHFEHKGHLCMVFDNLSLNLREILRKFGNNVGINLNATRAYAHQIFVGLLHMKKCSIVHADLKPDNILVNESRNVLKICDLGTAIDRSDAATAQNEPNAYLVSRFYRAPEIILGMPFDYGVDMWSIGCTLYELYTGKILFTGDSNNQMLKTIMEVRGRLTPKLYKHGVYSMYHFDDMGRFLSRERDEALGKITLRTLSIIKPSRDLRTRLVAASSGMDDGEARDLGLFVDLLDQCLALNPEKRIKPLDALRHPFISSRPLSHKSKR